MRNSAKQNILNSFLFKGVLGELILLIWNIIAIKSIVLTIILLIPLCLQFFLIYSTFSYRVILDKKGINYKWGFTKFSYSYSEIKNIRYVIVSGKKVKGIEIEFADGKKIEVRSNLKNYDLFISKIQKHFPISS